MRTLLLSLLSAAALATPAFAQDAPPAPPTDVAVEAPVITEVPGGALDIPLPDVKVDDQGIVTDGTRRFHVGRRGPLSTLRIIVVHTPDDVTALEPADEADPELTVLVPKDDSTSMIIDGRYRLHVGWRNQLSLLRVVRDEELPSVTDEESQAATAAIEQPTISGDAESLRPQPPMSIDASSGANAGYSLSSPAPNPVVESATIEFALARPAATTLSVFDETGRLVATLVNDDLDAGHHSVRFDASGLAAGRYLCRLSSGSFNATTMLNVVR